MCLFDALSKDLTTGKCIRHASGQGMNVILCEKRNWLAEYRVRLATTLVEEVVVKAVGNSGEEHEGMRVAGRAKMCRLVIDPKRKEIVPTRCR